MTDLLAVIEQTKQTMLERHRQWYRRPLRIVTVVHPDLFQALTDCGYVVNSHIPLPSGEMRVYVAAKNEHDAMVFLPDYQACQILHIHPIPFRPARRRRAKI